MEKTIQKYTERLAVLKENRASTVDTNTDAENELYDQLIKQVAEFIRDTKQLNILRVSNNEVAVCDWHSVDTKTGICSKCGKYCLSKPNPEQTDC